MGPYLQDLAGEEKAVHHLRLEQLPDVEHLVWVVHPDEDLQRIQQCFPHTTL